MGSTVKLIVLDRDGSLGQISEDFVRSPDDWLPQPGALEAAAAAGCEVVLAEDDSRVEEDRPQNRLNDGFVAADGSLWFGSMDDSEKTVSGALYRFYGGAVERHDDGYHVTNGPAMSPDGRTLFTEKLVIDPARRPVRQTGVMGAFDVLGNVMFGLRLKPGLNNKERKEVAKYYLDLVGLSKFLHSLRPNHLDC